MPRNGVIATRLPRERALAKQIEEVASIGGRKTSDGKFQAGAIAWIGGQVFWYGHYDHIMDHKHGFKPLGRAAGTTASRIELEEIRLKAQILLGTISQATGAVGASCSLMSTDERWAAINLYTTNPLKNEGVNRLLPQGKPGRPARALREVERAVTAEISARPVTGDLAEFFGRLDTGNLPQWEHLRDRFTWDRWQKARRQK